MHALSRTLILSGSLMLAGFWSSLCLAPPCLAQSEVIIVGPEDNTGTTVIDFGESGDFELEGTLQLDELRFDKVGDLVVRFPGNQPRRQIDKRGRVNLPSKIQAGVTYRKVEIQFQILSDLQVDEILAPVVRP